jgi:hypothetical protein
LQLISLAGKFMNGTDSSVFIPFCL